MPPESPKVLVIDDDEAFLDITRTVLEPAGYRVFSATSGAAGVAVAREQKPEVVVVDLLMAPPDGFAVCDQLRGCPDTRATAVLVVSGIGRKMHKHFASPDVGARLDADGYLEKPVDPQTLIKRVAEMAELARARGASRMTGAPNVQDEESR